MNSILIYALPSISAIAIKVIFLWYGRKAVRSASAWVWTFLCGLLGVNLCELLLFSFSHNAAHPSALAILIIYYVFAVTASAGYFAIAMQLAGRFSPFICVCTLSLLAAGVIVLLIPNAAISGAQSIGYSASRIPGPFYWILQLLIPSFWLAGCAALTHAALKSADWVSKRRALALLVGSVPLVLTIVAVVMLMQLGLAINATVVVSFMINLLLGLLIYTEYESGVFRFLSFIPRTQEHRLIFHAARSAYEMSSHGLSIAVANFEKALVTDALNRCKGNKTGAANLLGVSRATLRRKLSSNG